MNREVWSQVSFSPAVMQGGKQRTTDIHPLTNLEDLYNFRKEWEEVFFSCSGWSINDSWYQHMQLLKSACSQSRSPKAPNVLTTSSFTVTSCNHSFATHEQVETQEMPHYIRVILVDT